MVSDVNIHEVCERVRSLILAEFPRGLAVLRDYDISIPDFRGDREQLIQAVLNIAHNAAQALSERVVAGRRLHHAAHPHGAPGHAGQAALPTGTGLAYRGQRPGNPGVDPGSHFLSLGIGARRRVGSGLTLAQTFVQQHQGMIECESKPGLETLFKIVIPLP